MIEMIHSFFESLGEFFSNVWNFLTFVWDELTQFFRMLAPAVKFFQTLINTLPPVFMVFGIAMLVVLIIYVILGRTAGGD